MPEFYKSAPGLLRHVGFDAEHHALARTVIECSACLAAQQSEEHSHG